MVLTNLPIYLERDVAPTETQLIPEGLMVRIAERLRILGQPVRLRLVELLADGPSTPQELSDALGLSQQNVSKHLLSLHRAGVVSRRPDAPYVFYALADPSAVTTLRLTLDAVSSHLQNLANVASGSQPTAGSSGLEDRRHQPAD